MAERMPDQKKKKVEKLKRRSTNTESDTLAPDRGQVDPQLVIGTIFLAIIAGPLIKAGIELQQGLAETPAFTPLFAAIVAICLIGGVAAAFLGLD